MFAMNVLDRICRGAATGALLAALVLAPPAHAQNPNGGEAEDPAATPRGPEGGAAALRQLAGRTDADAAADLSRFLSEADDPLLRAQAAALLGIIGGDDVVPLLSRALYDPSAPVRLHAVRALGRVKGTSATPLLCDVLRQDADSRVRRTALRWLAALPGEEARFAVEQAATDSDPSVRRDAKRALATWAKPTP